MNHKAISALTFDVFGTVVDWRGSIIRAGERLAREKGVQADWTAFADAWRAGYRPAMDRVRRGDLGWTKIDDLHRMILDELIPQFGLEMLTEADRAELNRVWHRLDPWPDAVSGLIRLRERYILATLSNGNVALLVNMAKRAGLPWDCVLSAELFRHYKPDSAVYLGAADLLGLHPEEVMMVAAHNGDLQAANAVGMATAFVSRPTEYGAQQTTDLDPAPFVDVTARDFNDLADKLVPTT